MIPRNKVISKALQSQAVLSEYIKSAEDIFSRAGGSETSGSRAPAGAERSLESERKPQNNATKGTACIKSHIITKNPYIPLYDNKTDIEFYPGMIKFKRENKEKDWQSRPRPNGQSAMSKRGQVKGFSKKSRSNFLQLFGKIDGKIELWVDLTFHDQVLKDKTEEEKAKFSSEKIRVFLQWFKRNYPDAWMIWKREWQPRKSGILLGMPCPHLHTYVNGITEEEKNEILEKWVEITGVQGEYKIQALKVAFNRESWRWVNSQSEAQRYATKYGSKTTEGAGRSWGKVGPVPIAEPKKLQLTAYQQVLLRRALRAYTKRSQKKLGRKDRIFKKYQLTNRLRRNDFQGFILIPGLELVRIIEYIRQVTGGKEDTNNMYRKAVKQKERNIWKRE